MGTQAGTGYSEAADSRDAGVAAASQAMERAGASSCDLAIALATTKHEPGPFVDGVRSVVGSAARIIGGSAVGTITNDRLGYGAYNTGVAVLSSDSIRFDVIDELMIDNAEHAAGQAVGKAMATADLPAEHNLLFLYDSIRVPAADGLRLNMGTWLVDGLGESLGEWPPAAGVGLLGDMSFGLTSQWVDDRILQQHVIALVTSGGVRMDTAIMHGCTPMGAYHTVTASDGPAVLEIDGRPALQVIDEILGPAARAWEEYPLYLMLGVNRGDKFGPFQEADYATRVCLNIDRDRQAVIMFEPDLRPGSEIQLMRSDVDVSYIDTQVSTLFDALDGRTPVFAFYIDCAGRAKTYAGTDYEEAEALQRALGDRVPLLGMYSGVEIAKVGPALQALDLTGVLCLFSE